MAKKIIIGIVSVLMTLYVVFAIKLYDHKQKEILVHDLVIQIEDSLDHPYVGSKEIIRLLQDNRIQLLDKKMTELKLGQIEQAIASHPLVKRAECAVSPSGCLCVKIDQRIPVLRVFVENGDHFFLDEDAEIMRIHKTVAVDVPIASIQREDPKHLAQLYDLSRLLRKDRFWDAMIAQILMDATGKIKLVLRLGEMEICMGKAENMEFKLRALRSFYEEALPKVGWDRYKRLNFEFENQIVCTKK